jgi:hypothetical protein
MGMGKARGTTPLNPRGVHKDIREHARSRASGTTPLNPRGVHKDTWEHAA